MLGRIQKKGADQGVTLVELLVALAITTIGATMAYRVVSTMEAARATHRTIVETNQETSLVTDVLRSRFYNRSAVAGFELRDKVGSVFKTVDIDEDLGGGDLRQTLISVVCRPVARSPGFNGCGLTCPAGKAPVVYITTETTTRAARTDQYPRSDAIDGMAICFSETDDFVSAKVIAFGFDPRKPGKVRRIEHDWPMPKDIFVRGSIQLAP